MWLVSHVMYCVSMSLSVDNTMCSVCVCLCYNILHCSVLMCVSHNYHKRRKFGMVEGLALHSNQFGGIKFGEFT